MSIRTIQNLSHLGDMMEEVRSGRVMPASFQRPYVWTRTDVEEMWASIASNDPLGGILLWIPDDEETARAMSRSHLGPVGLKSDSRNALILDGQNRLVTFAWSMVDPGTIAPGLAGHEVWQDPGDLVLTAEYDGPKGPSIRFMPRADVAGLAMPIWKLFDNREFNDHVVKNWNGKVETEVAVEWLGSLQRNVRDARVVVSTIEGGDAEQAKRRFLRMARVGVPMSAEDFDSIAKTI